VNPAPILTPAEPDDAEAIAAVRNAAADELTKRFGTGHWTNTVTGKGVWSDMRRQVRVFVVRRGARIAATLSLQTRKPWAIDVKYFTPCARPIYLTNMAVHPDFQRQGVGRGSLDAAIAVARDWPGDAVRLDAYDADAGAGDFYARCGFREVGKRVYRTTPLRYFERIIRW
jgi:GNAT superfamily N-acetyltransferase